MEPDQRIHIRHMCFFAFQAGSIVGEDRANDGDEQKKDSNTKRFKADPLSTENNALGSDVKFDWNAALADLRPSAADDQDDNELTEESLRTLTSTKLPSKASMSSHQQRSQEEFEDLVKQAPNDSQLWIEYMQFYIDQAEVDRARAVAERALASIFYR